MVGVPRISVEECRLQAEIAKLLPLVVVVVAVVVPAPVVLLWLIRPRSMLTCPSLLAGKDVPHQTENHVRCGGAWYRVDRGNAEGLLRVRVMISEIRHENVGQEQLLHVKFDGRGFMGDLLRRIFLIDACRKMA